MDLQRTLITQLIESHGFLDYPERGIDSDGNNNNLLDKLQDTIGRGQNPISILPYVGILGKFEVSILLIMFPSNIRSEEQEEKRKQILAAARGACGYIKHAPSSPSVQVGKDSLSPMERAAGRESMVLDIKVKLQAEKERMVLDIKVKLLGLWLRLLKLGATDDPLSSFQYGTILLYPSTRG
ncbi:hypothetical protein OIU74_008320 [Salix koriyanagi]|uniref:Uncharacterized protein n=1 Tax=Salix koriyanagi TaxID=2511006 RepID=A0A9Q0U5M4_9ROSI|nr:hypothetical protein OIU74_008320 [Salix koriyanagi]